MQINRLHRIVATLIVAVSIGLIGLLNGDVILVEGGEGMTMQLSWRGAALVTEFGGVTLTFNKV